MFVALVPTALALLLFVSLSWVRHWALKGHCNKTKGIVFYKHHNSENEGLFSEADCGSEEEACHEGASDVISRSTLLRIVLFFLVIFLVSGCTIVVMVRLRIGEISEITRYKMHLSITGGFY